MKRFLPALAVIGLLSACGDGTNPFDEPLDETDPSTLNNKFLFDVENKHTMNAVTYDETNNRLVINNLPFDGPDGVYDFRRNQKGVSIFASRQTPTTGQVQTYAVFMANDNAQVTAAAGANWVDFGFTGANVKRSGYNLPSGVGEYIYLGTYGGVRTRNDQTGVEIVTGDVTLLLDVLDFDEAGDGGDGVLEGAIVGNVTGRTRTTPDGTPITAQLPNISLTVEQYDPETGTFDDGIVVTGFNGDVRDQGSWEGMISGSDGGSLGAYLVMEGTAEMQAVQYEVITWENGNDSGVVSGYDRAEDFQGLLTQVSNGQEIPLLTADTSSIPPGATQTTEIQTVVIETEGDAQEVGVILADQVPTP